MSFYKINFMVSSIHSQVSPFCPPFYLPENQITIQIYKYFLKDY